MLAEYSRKQFFWSYMAGWLCFERVVIIGRRRYPTFSGVKATSPAYPNALAGNAYPRAPGSGVTPEQHNLGNTLSDYTSWTTRRITASVHAELGTWEEGVVLEKSFPSADMVASPDYSNEAEVLIIGPVTGAKVTKP